MCYLCDGGHGSSDSVLTSLPPGHPSIVFQLPAVAIRAASLIGQVLVVKQLGHEANCSAHVMCEAYCSIPPPPNFSKLHMKTGFGLGN
jgi:hypothetical protein